MSSSTAASRRSARPCSADSHRTGLLASGNLWRDMYSRSAGGFQEPGTGRGGGGVYALSRRVGALVADRDPGAGDDHVSATQAEVAGHLRR